MWKKISTFKRKNKMNTFKHITLFLALVFMSTTACTDDASSTENKVPVASLLIGHWELDQAIRNGKVAPTMEGTYFTFNDNNSMRSNMMGSDQASVYNLNDRVITQSSNGVKTEYLVENITSDSLRLTTTIQGFNFDLSMLKAEKPTEKEINPET